MERNEQLQAKSGMYYSIVKIGGGVNKEYTFFFLCLKAASDRFIEQLFFPCFSMSDAVMKSIVKFQYSLFGKVHPLMNGPREIAYAAINFVRHICRL